MVNNMCTSPETETSRAREIRKYEPILGAPGVSAWTVMFFKLKQFFAVDLFTKASVFVWISTWMAWKLLDRGKLASDVAVLSVVGLMGLAWMNWCMRKHVGPFIEAVCVWIKGGPSLPSTPARTTTTTITKTRADIPIEDK